MKIASAILLLAIAITKDTVHADTFPFFENGYDFEGGSNNIGQAIGADVNDCFTKCTGTLGASLTPKCGAVSYYQGVCYFKAKRGIVSVKADVNSTAVYDNAPTPCATILPNTDYVGNDIGNKPGSVTDCCKICQAYPGCRAYSWNNDNGGTCWLKSKRGLVIEKEDVQSGVAYPADDEANQRHIELDVDYVGHDIGNMPSKTAEGCFDICIKTKACTAFSWSDYNQGTCWLKAFKGDTITKPGVVSGVAVSAPPVKYMPDMQFTNLQKFGPGDFPGASPDGCVEQCKQKPGCIAFQWYDNAWCVLLYVASNPVYTPGRYAGMLNPGYPKCVSSSDDTDIVGNNIASKSGISDAEDCPGFCAATPGCTAYSWSNYMGGTCWLKNGIAPTVSKVGVKSCTSLN